MQCIILHRVNAINVYSEQRLNVPRFPYPPVPHSPFKDSRGNAVIFTLISTHDPMSQIQQQKPSSPIFTNVAHTNFKIYFLLTCIICSGAVATENIKENYIFKKYSRQSQRHQWKNVPISEDKFPFMDAIFASWAIFCISLFVIQYNIFSGFKSVCIIPHFVWR